MCVRKKEAHQAEEEDGKRRDMLGKPNETTASTRHMCVCVQRHVNTCSIVEPTKARVLEQEPIKIKKKENRERDLKF